MPIQTVSRSWDFVSARDISRELRNIAIEDLLNRKPTKIDWSEMRNELAARTILVTGGGGSIGSELCRQIAQLDPRHLVIVDTSEFNLYRIHIELCDSCPNLSFSIMLVDVCDAASVERVFERHAPDVVFHTAAYKHVPMLESHLREAVRVNVLGTQTVARMAARHAVGRFVLISSDKSGESGECDGCEQTACGEGMPCHS